MPEAEWLSVNSATLMLAQLGAGTSGRKLRLFCCAGCRRIWDTLPSESRAAVEIAEQYADALASPVELLIAFRRAEKTALERGRAWAPDALTYATAAACDAVSESGEKPFPLIRTMDEIAFAVGCAAGEAAHDSDYDRMVELARNREAKAQRDTLRDVFGNPFRPVTFSPEWRTDTALSLARQMYESRDFGAAPILADALQDAGCDSDELLNHLRDATAPHVRGCWAVDLVLGKE